MILSECPSQFADAQHSNCTTHANVQGFDVAKKALLEFLDTFKTEVDPSDREVSGNEVKVAMHNIDSTG